LFNPLIGHHKAYVRFSGPFPASGAPCDLHRDGKANDSALGGVAQQQLMPGAPLNFAPFSRHSIAATQTQREINVVPFSTAEARDVS
jgi:hypothetical protein